MQTKHYFLNGGQKKQLRTIQYKKKHFNSIYSLIAMDDVKQDGINLYIKQYYSTTLELPSISWCLLYNTQKVRCCLIINNYSLTYHISKSTYKIINWPKFDIIHKYLVHISRVRLKRFALEKMYNNNVGKTILHISAIHGHRRIC